MLKASQEEMKTRRRASQENMEATVDSIWSKLERTIQSQVGDILESSNQWTQDLCEELNSKIEKTQLGSKRPVACEPEASARR
jgi:hypothetical protein